LLRNVETAIAITITRCCSLVHGRRDVCVLTARPQKNSILHTISTWSFRGFGFQKSMRLRGHARRLTGAQGQEFSVCSLIKSFCPSKRILHQTPFTMPDPYRSNPVILIATFASDRAILQETVEAALALSSLRKDPYRWSLLDGILLGIYATLEENISDSPIAHIILIPGPLKR
jgi:hypothetical protein